MRIIVCIKRVVDTETRVKIGPDGKDIDHHWLGNLWDAPDNPNGREGFEDGRIGQLESDRVILFPNPAKDHFTLDLRAYEENLRRLMNLIRAAFRVDDIPVVIGRISDSGRDADGKVWDHGDIVRNAQASFVKKDAAAALVTSTDNYDYSDKWHYDSAGYIDLGRQFADAVRGISKP